MECFHSERKRIVISSLLDSGRRKKNSPIHIQIDIPENHNLTSLFLFCFYWIEVGKAMIEENSMTLDVYEKDLINMIDIGILLNLILEHFKKTDSPYGVFIFASFTQQKSLNIEILKVC